MVFKEAVFSTAGLLLFATLAAVPGQARRAESDSGVSEATLPAAPPVASPAQSLVEALGDDEIRRVVSEVLERNPGVLAAQARARAAARRAPQVRALPDPAVGLTAFVLPPETRVGPQRLMTSYSQPLPWLAKLTLKERAVLFEAAALEAEAEAERLRLVTEARRLVYEIAFLDLQRQVTEGFRGHLIQHEEIARARYSTGVGLGQGVVKLQAEITRVDGQLLDIESRRVGLRSRLNELRDRPAAYEVPVGPMAGAVELQLETALLATRASRTRPELAAAEARVRASAVRVELAELGFRPDFKVGLTYTLVESRDDRIGRLQPPEGNGDDILGIQGGVSLPVWRGRLRAGVQEAVEMQSAAAQTMRGVEAQIERTVGELGGRLPLDWSELRLLEDLLIVQAEEALESAQAGYVTGTLNALDLLDAEHVLFGARIAVARARADYLISLAALEGAVGEPLNTQPIESE